MSATKKITCKHPSKGYPWGSSVIRRWKTCLPFVWNPRGILLHRVRNGITFIKNGKEEHSAVHYWCANGTTAECEYFAVPPNGKLLCARCEAAAARAGEKSSSELAGHHVHTGELRAVRLCCSNESN